MTCLDSGGQKSSKVTASLVDAGEGIHVDDSGALKSRLLVNLVPNRRASIKGAMDKHSVRPVSDFPWLESVF